MRFVDIAELESRLRQDMNEKVGAFEEQLRKMQQDYPQSADGFEGMQHQGEQVSAGDRTELTIQLDEVKMVRIELQHQREQQERHMAQMKAQQMGEIARRMEQLQREMVQIRELEESQLAQKRERQERELAQIMDMKERRERDIAERREQQERELTFWKLRQEREIAEVKEQQKQQERALREKQRQLEEEEDLLSKKFVSLGQTKLKRSVNEEVRLDTPGSKLLWTRDEMGIWRRASPVFDSPVKRNKVELCRDERMLDVDGLFRKGDEQTNKLTDAQLVQQQMKEFSRLLATGQN